MHYNQCSFSLSSPPPLVVPMWDWRIWVISILRELATARVFFGSETKSGYLLRSWVVVGVEWLILHSLERNFLGQFSDTYAVLFFVVIFSLWLKKFKSRYVDGRPKAILAISAHWDTQEPAVNAVSRNATIHDFYGFPSALYQVSSLDKSFCSLFYQCCASCCYLVLWFNTVAASGLSSLCMPCQIRVVKTLCDFFPGVITGKCILAEFSHAPWMFVPNGCVSSSSESEGITYEWLLIHSLFVSLAP